MNIQAWIVIALLGVLVGLSVRSELASPAPVLPDAAQQAAEFSVTPIAQGHYVMRANDKIFYCVSNKCTGIQLMTANQAAAAQAAQQQQQQAAEQQ